MKPNPCWIHGQNFTCTKCEQVASSAVADHDFPREFVTINLKAQLGKNFNDAIIRLIATLKTCDLNSKTSTISPYKCFNVRLSKV